MTLKKQKTVYEILSNILGVKFKVQYTNSEIEFIEIYSFKNLTNKKTGHLLFLDESSIWFYNTKDFLIKLIKFIDEKLKVLEHEFNSLQKHQMNDLIVDENYMFLRFEDISYSENKLDRFRSKLEKLLLI